MLVRTEEQLELARTVRAVLAKRSDSAAVRVAMESADGFDRDLWRTLCEQIGVAALPVPEEYDGVGASLVETSMVLEELGHSLAPTPLLASTWATVAVLLYGSESQRAELLPRLSAGAIGALASHEAVGDLVLDGAAAEVLLAFDGDDLQVLAAAPEGAPTMDPTTRLARARTTTSPTAVVDVAMALTSSMQLGVAQRGLDMTVAYAKERVQFGRPIGSFQALKHRLADCHALVESARSASWGAVDAAAAYVEEPAADRANTLHLLAAVAKSWCGDALDRVAGETIQLHGGIAITWEHDAHLVLKRAHALNQLFGPAHRVRAGLL